MRRLLKWAGIALAAFVALIVVIAIVAPAKETDEPTTTEQAADEPETEEPEAAPEEDVDTGRMSEGEYDLLTSLDDELIREGQQWSGEYAACTRIGQTGDLAGFRDCVREAWEGFEGAAGAASFNAPSLAMIVVSASGIESSAEDRAAVEDRVEGSRWVVCCGYREF